MCNQRAFRYSILHLQISYQYLKTRKHYFKEAFSSISWVKHTKYPVFLFHVILHFHSGKNLNVFGFPRWKPNRIGLSYPSCKKRPWEILAAISEVPQILLRWGLGLCFISPTVLDIQQSKLNWTEKFGMLHYQWTDSLKNKNYSRFKDGWGYFM